MEGKRYMDSRAAARLWDISPRTVSRYCREQRVPGAFKDSAGRWCIPVDAIRPLTDSILRDVLILTLHLQANPDYPIDYRSLGIAPQNLPHAYRHLVQLGHLREFDNNLPPEELPYRVKLTNKGIECATQGQGKEKADPAELLRKWGPAIAAIISRLAGGN